MNNLKYISVITTLNDQNHISENCIGSVIYFFILTEVPFVYLESRSVARKETLDVHQKNWVCHIYCQINVQKKKKTCLLGINMLV